MKIDNLSNDDAVLKELGLRIAQARLASQLTQSELAEQSGVSKRTVERIEAGAPAQTDNVVRILRALKLLDNLDKLIPAPEPSPLALLKQQSAMPQRTSKSRKLAAQKPWTWDEES